MLLSLDDSQGSQITTGVPELAKRSMRATFFVMTVPLGKPNWMPLLTLRRILVSSTWDGPRLTAAMARP